MLLLNRTLIRMAKGLWGWILAIVGLKMITLMGTALFAGAISGFLGNLYSPMFTAAEAGRAILSALWAAALMFVSELLTGEAEYRCNAKANHSLRTQIFSKTLELDVGNIEKIGPVSAITSSVDGVEQMQVYYSKYLPGLIYCVCAPIYLFFQMRQASLTVASALCLISLILLPLNNVFRVRIERLKTEYWSAMEDLTSYYLESVQGLTTFKLYQQDQARSKTLSQKAMAFHRKIMDVMKVNFSSFLLTDGLIYGAVVLAGGIVCWDLLQGSISFSDALMVLLLSYGFFSSVRQLMNATHTALAGVSAADKVEALLNMDTSRPYEPSRPMEPNPFAGIRMEHVRYAYPGRVPALKDISLTIPKGKVTALVGLSGCGKSTIAGLLMRFFDPAEGRILLEGQDYLSLTPEELRQRVIMVPQQVSLFSGTIADNLRLASPKATDEELMESLEEVRLADWVRAQPKGLYTQVGDAGGKLSGGQRQKIGIARALLRQGEYIIFDESTSSVDVDSEREIWACIQRLALKRTLIIISHRLSSIRDADQIYVLSGGEVAQQGRHQQLMEQPGLYRQLVKEQNQLEGGGLCG